MATEPSPLSSCCCDTTEHLDKVALNILQPLESRKERALASILKTATLHRFMITAPFGLYLTTKSYLFEGVLGMSNRDSYFLYQHFAVAAAHVVLALYVYVNLE
jgi:hypothetical protein